MGQRLTPNPFGDCETCNWPWNYTPYNVTVEISGVKNGDNYPGWPLPNGFFTLNPALNCWWDVYTADRYVSFDLRDPTSVYAEIFGHGLPGSFAFFFHEVDQACKTSFVNQYDKETDFYYGGTAIVMAGLTHPPAEFVPAYGLLPSVDWKYEQMQAENGNEQVYLGSRKYKTNCRVLYDPALIDP